MKIHSMFEYKGSTQGRVRLLFGVSVHLKKYQITRQLWKYSEWPIGEVIYEDGRYEMAMAVWEYMSLLNGSVWRRLPTVSDIQTIRALEG